MNLKLFLKMKVAQLFAHQRIKHGVTGQDTLSEEELHAYQAAWGPDLVKQRKCLPLKRRLAAKLPVIHFSEDEGIEIMIYNLAKTEHFRKAVKAAVAPYESHGDIRHPDFQKWSQEIYEKIEISKKPPAVV